MELETPVSNAKRTSPYRKLNASKIAPYSLTPETPKELESLRSLSNEAEICKVHGENLNLQLNLRLVQMPTLETPSLNTK